MTNQGAVQTSTDQIYEDLRRLIVSGQYGPGDRLRMGALAEDYGTSVTPVREALRMLLQDGLVRVEPHSGYSVARISLKQLDDLLDLREVLEVAAIEKAITKMTRDHLDELAAAKGRRFHELIARASGNRELERLVVNLYDKLARFVDHGRPREVTVSAHEQIVEALHAGDVKAAEQAVVEETRLAREVLMRRLIEQDGASWYLGRHSGT